MEQSFGSTPEIHPKALLLWALLFLLHFKKKQLPNLFYVMKNLRLSIHTN
uniref:Uncharacterized protein n=1 Tax=uncultured Flavobacteriia bacterium TaxID=212695 RepID=H6RDX5_9BACT|nr:hypothetical protein VIS_S3ATA30022 [uncultured Flavobacteriia bacterium]